MTNLASTYQDAQRLDKAIDLYEEAAKRAGVRFGPAHRTTLTIKSNLAGAYLDQGRFTDASNVCQEACPLAEKSLGANNEIAQQLRLTWEAAKSKRDK
jgi:hypothetical protein